jgi:predicted nucleotidyltransferase
VRIISLDRTRAIEELREAAQALVLCDARALAVGLFGSLARGKALPSSDADILIALRHHAERRWFDRIPEYVVAFDRASLPVEVFPFTTDELVRMSPYPGFVRTALRELVHLAGDADLWDNLTY